MVGPFDHLIFVVLTLVLPIRAWQNFRAMMRAPEADAPRRRLRAYRMIVITQWLFAAVVAALWIATKRPWGAIGLTLGHGGLSNFGLVTLVLAAVVVGLAQRKSLKDERTQARLRERFEHFERLLPHTDQELRWFAAVSITAGVCEELLYRGFLLWYLGQRLEVVLAVVVASLIFGFGHVYQGPRGVLSTAIIGAFMSVLYLTSGSLLLPMLTHGAIDLSSGIAAAAAFRRTHGEPATSDPAGTPPDPASPGARPAPIE